MSRYSDTKIRSGIVTSPPPTTLSTRNRPLKTTLRMSSIHVYML